ncbi:MAG: TRAP transporter small permease subunit [Rhodobacteraceae bacterium]|nr:TRAP transporter small permease subunit [Paracoccaceae bacterium]
MRAVAALGLALDRIALAGAVLALVVMVGAMTVQIVARYVFAQPPFWTEELARYAMIWAGCLGATVAFRRMADPRVVDHTHSPRPWLRPLASLGAGLAAAAFLGPILWFGLYGPGMNPARGHIARAARRNSEALDIPMSWVALAPAVMAGLILLHAGLLLILSFRRPGP